MSEHLIIVAPIVSGQPDLQLPQDASLKASAVISALWNGLEIGGILIGTYGASPVLHVYAVAARTGVQADLTGRLVAPARVLTIDQAWADTNIKPLLQARGVKDDGTGLPDRNPHVWARESIMIDRSTP